MRFNLGEKLNSRQINEERLSIGKKSIGFINPVLYR